MFAAGPTPAPIFETFWQGRLIPGARIDTVPFIEVCQSCALRPSCFCQADGSTVCLGEVWKSPFACFRGLSAQVHSVLHGADKVLMLALHVPDVYSLASCGCGGTTALVAPPSSMQETDQLTRST